MRVKVKIVGHGIDIDVPVTKINMLAIEREVVQLDQLANGQWEMTVSKNLEHQVVDRVKSIVFDNFHNAKYPCHVVWRGSGMITTLQPHQVNEMTNREPDKHGGYIHFIREPGSKWELHTRDTLNKKIKARQLTKIEFDWNIYKS